MGSLKDAADNAVIASILVVDDHSASLAAVSAVLEPLGHRIVGAYSGAEALGCLQREDFAVILLDVHMPEIDGFRTAALIKQRTASRHVPILFVTAMGADATATAKGYANGCADWIHKPYDPEILRAKVAVFVDLYVQREQLKRQADMLRERERFIGILGHDLRTPLTSIVFGAGALLAHDELPTGQRQALRRVAASAGRMARLIDDLVDFTRSRQGGLPMDPKPTDLHAVCRQVIEEIEVANPGRTIVFRTVGEGHGEWDPDRLAQMVSNLVTNALAYSPPDAAVDVSVRERAGSVVVEVTNHGPPIPHAAMATLFDPFKRVAHAEAAARPSRLRAGLGLGLFIVHEVVRSHGGSIRVASDVATGTTFVVELPRVAVAASAARRT